jgi:hypothetical protein
MNEKVSLGHQKENLCWRGSNSQALGVFNLCSGVMVLKFGEEFLN